MFRSSSTCSSPFSLTDLDMWDTESHFAAETSAWCGMATVSGAGFLSKLNTSTSGSSGGFRQNDQSLRKWQSSCHLAPEGPTRAFPLSPGAELRAVRGASGFRQAEVGQWLHNAHDHIDTQLDRLMNRSSQLSYNRTSAQLLDRKEKQLSEVMSALEQEKEAVQLTQFEKGQQREELRDKIGQLEKDLLHMRSNLGRGSFDPQAGRTSGFLGKTTSQEDLNRQERQNLDAELCKLRVALRDAEVRAKTQEEERNQALQQLQTSTETQRALLTQIEEMKQKFSFSRQNHSEVQEQLHEANDKISQACLEKAVLSTQVLKLEDDMKELTRRLSDQDHLIQEKEGLQQMTRVLDKQDEETVPTEQTKVLREVNEKLTCELEVIKQKLNSSQSQLQELAAERVTKSEQVTDLEAKCSQLIRDNEELCRKNVEQHEELTETKERCCQLRESLEFLASEKLTLQDKCLHLEDEVLEKEEKLHRQEEEHQKQDAVQAQSTEELKAVARHWTEKWQKVALNLQSTQEELEELKKNNSRDEVQTKDVHLEEIEKLKKEGQKDKEEINKLLQHKAKMETVQTKPKNESDSLLRVELEACKQELELEQSRWQAVHQHYGDEGGDAPVQTQDKETVTDLAQSSLLWEPTSDPRNSHNKPPQVCVQSSEVGRPKQIVAEGEQEVREKEDVLKSLERLREMETKEASLKISALELEACGNHHYDGSQADVSAAGSLRAQLEESRSRMSQLQQEKTLALQKLQTLRQLYLVTDEKGMMDKNICPGNLETEQQRMITEQLKSLFKEREGQEAGKVDTSSEEAQSAASSLQDWTPTSKAQRSAANRRSWQQDSGLMPVFEEDEETSDWLGEEEVGKPAEEADDEEDSHTAQQMSTAASFDSLKAKDENLLQASLRGKQPIHDCPEKSCDEVPNCYQGSDEVDLQQRRSPSLYPDGVFLAELVTICSPDEDEEEGEDK